MSGANNSRIASLHDVELAALAAAGGRAAYGELVRRHASAVRAVLRRMGADPATADDVAQDAFLAGFEAVAEFRGEGTFAAWIKRTAARLSLRRFRRKLTLDARAEWALNPRTTLWLAADNLFDEDVEVSQTGNGVAGYGPPRAASIGLRLSY